MRSLDVVVAHADRDCAQNLAHSLGHHFRSVSVVTTVDELRSTIARRRLRLAVVDLDLLDMEGVKHLRQELGVCVICTHRIPDEKMWAEALGHGALDCCETSDIAGIVDAIRRDLRERSQVA